MGNTFQDTVGDSGMGGGRYEVNADMLAGITPLAPLSGAPKGGVIAQLKQDFAIPDARPGQAFADLIKSAPGSAPKTPGLS